MNKKLVHIGWGTLLLAGLTHSTAEAISVNITSATTPCAVSVTGDVVFTKPPATNVTIDFIPPGGAPPVRLITNLPLKDGSPAAYQWSGTVPGYASIPAEAQVKVTTNRQVSSTASLPTCTTQ